MSPLAMLALRLAAPVVADALKTLLTSIEERGMRPDDALQSAIDIVRGIDSSFPEWSAGARRAHAIGRIRAQLQWMTGHPAEMADVEALYALAARQVRQPAGTVPAQPPPR